eukprot:1769342-Ditylum_brightwellii.AAC.1
MSQPEQAIKEASAKQTSWGKRKKKFCDYHGLCYYDTDEHVFVQAHRKHVQSMHCITEQQRLWQVLFVKDTERCAKRRNLT